eukprot:scaffold201_cov405-Prasinococcus_capsulatus_cf.AAC.22
MSPLAELQGTSPQAMRVLCWQGQASGGHPGLEGPGQAVSGPSAQHLGKLPPAMHLVLASPGQSGSRALSRLRRPLLPAQYQSVAVAARRLERRDSMAEVAVPSFAAWCLRAAVAASHTASDRIACLPLMRWVGLLDPSPPLSGQPLGRAAVHMSSNSDAARRRRDRLACFGRAALARTPCKIQVSAGAVYPCVARRHPPSRDVAAALGFFAYETFLTQTRVQATAHAGGRAGLGLVHAPACSAATQALRGAALRRRACRRRFRVTLDDVPVTADASPPPACVVGRRCYCYQRQGPHGDTTR